MTVLIAAYNSGGCIGRCDAKCYNASTLDCQCVCGGMNHGAGLLNAAENTAEMAEQWIEDYTELHPDAVRFDVFPDGNPGAKPVQLALPGFDLRNQHHSS